MLVERLERFGVPVWLVNTGWTRGPYGVGHRMSIAHTRNVVRAALGGELDNVETIEDPIFRVAVPVAVSGVPADVLVPRNNWPGTAACDAVARKLAGMFHDNLATYADGVSEGIRNAGPAPVDAAFDAEGQAGAEAQ